MGARAHRERVPPVTSVMGADTPDRRAAALAAALAALREGEPVALSTDTVYGLAADAADAAAVQRLFELKGRPAALSIAVLVGDRASAEKLVQLAPQARRITERFWPGPLTLVATRTRRAPSHLGRGATLGVRVPDDDLVRALATHGPLAVTSANLHGGPTPSTAEGVAEMFPSLRVVVDGGPRPGASSTVVDVTGPAPKLLRAGPVSLDEILAAAAAPEP